MTFRKSSYEKMYRYFEFSRPDGQDGLQTDEAIISWNVTSTDNADDSDVTATMILETSITGTTMIVYLLSGGTVGHTYTVKIQVVTSRGQKFEGSLTVSVT
jgi:hypothetical protein